MNINFTLVLLMAGYHYFSSILGKWAANFMGASAVFEAFLLSYSIIVKLFTIIIYGMYVWNNGFMSAIQMAILALFIAYKIIPFIYVIIRDIFSLKFDGEIFDIANMFSSIVAVPIFGYFSFTNLY